MSDVVVVFTGRNCTPCARLMPLVGELAEARPDLVVMEVDASTADLDVIRGWDVRAVPTLILDGVRSVGGPSCTERVRELIGEGPL